MAARAASPRPAGTKRGGSPAKPREHGGARGEIALAPEGECGVNLIWIKCFDAGRGEA
jgi:hypothetical protein